MKQRISKPVIGIIVAGLALAGFILWRGLSGHGGAKTQEIANSQQETNGPTAPKTSEVKKARKQTLSESNQLSGLTAADGGGSSEGPALDVFVQTAEERALAGAKVGLQFQLRGTKSALLRSNYLADASGFVRVRYPAQDLLRMAVSAEHEDYVAHKIVWDVAGGDTIPTNYIFKLVSGISIGGTVVDENGNPIPEVKLSLFRIPTGGAQAQRKGEQPDFASRTATTDAAGVWQIKELPGDLLTNMGFYVQHQDFPRKTVLVNSDAKVEKELRAGTHKIVLSIGLEVRGLVMDENGGPIAEATVWAGMRYSAGRKQTNSDPLGGFVFKGMSTGDVAFGAMAKGRAPKTKSIRVQPSMEPIVLKLPPGNLIRGVVQTKAGEPIADARVSLEQFGPRDRDYDFATNTDVLGKFEWDSAPEESTLFRVAKEGYMKKGGIPLQVNEENLITLQPARQVHGVVLDADTGQAITNFQAVAGQMFQFNDFYSPVPDGRPVSDSNGEFTLTLEDTQQTAIRVRADHYSEKVQKVPGGVEDVTRLEFRLKPSGALRGVVVGPDGSPKAGVQVALGKGEAFSPGNVQWQNGRLSSSGGTKIVETDASGSFNLGSPPESGGNVVALGKDGFGAATVEAVQSSGVLVLQPFGTIEGVFRFGGQPVAGQEFLFTLQGLGISMDFQNFKVTTDEQGTFKFEKVPATEGQIVRLVKMDNSWIHSYGTNVTVQAGQTLFVALGDAGALIRGRARLDVPPADGEVMRISGSLQTIIANRPGFSSAADAHTYYESAEWRALQRQQKYFACVAKENGSFEVDSVPPGTYTMRLSASPAGEGPMGRQTGPAATQEVIVPENADSTAPIDVGEMVLKKGGR